MIKIHLLLLCLSIGHFSINAQNTLEWMEPFTGLGNNTIDDISISDDQNIIYACGRFDETLNIYNETWNANEGRDIFLSAINSQGDKLWSIIGESDFNDESSVLSSYDNQVFWAGAIWQTTSLNGISLTPQKNSKALFLSAIDDNGTILWAQLIEGSQTKTLNAITSNQEGIFITGSFEDSLFLADTSLIAEAEQDLFLAKLSHNGELNWIVQAGIHGEITPKAIAIHENYIGITGKMFGSFNFGTDTIGTTTNDDDAFLALYNTDGDNIWAKRIGSTYTQQGTSLTFDEDGNIFTAGQFVGIIPLDSTTAIQTPNLYHNGYLIKYDITGNLLWGHSIGGENFDQITKIDYQNGYIYCTGSFLENFTFNGVSLLGNTNHYNSFFLQLHSDNGLYYRHFPIEGAGNILPSTIMAQDEILYTAFNSDASFNVANTNWNTSDGYDGFITKWSNTTSTIPVKADSIKIYPSLFNDILHIDTEKEIVHIHFYDINGRLLLKSKEKTTLTNTVPAGHILLDILFSDKTRYRKFLLKMDD